jgi:hypothetical protein
MTAAIDADIREIKTAVDSIAKATEANTKAIADLTTSVSGLREEMRLGFSDIKGKIDNLDGRLVAVEGNLKGLDARLWGFGGTLLGAVLAALLTIFGRFLFAGSPIS